MVIKKDKKKVLGEVFDDDRVRSFLNIEARPDVNLDYDRLEKAYRGMNIENFTTFVKFFLDAGCDINAANPDGKTFLQMINNHRFAGEYIEALKAAGAK